MRLTEVRQFNEFLVKKGQTSTKVLLSQRGTVAGCRSIKVGDYVPATAIVPTFDSNSSGLRIRLAGEKTTCHFGHRSLLARRLP